MNANPFLKKRTYRVDEALLTTIRSIPGLGGVKARTLLEHFGSMKSYTAYIGYKSMVKVHVPVEFKESKIAKLTFLRVLKKCFLFGLGLPKRVCKYTINTDHGKIFSVSR